MGSAWQFLSTKKRNNGPPDLLWITLSAITKLKTDKKRNIKSEQKVFNV